MTSRATSKTNLPRQTVGRRSSVVWFPTPNTQHPTPPLFIEILLHHPPLERNDGHDDEEEDDGEGGGFAEVVAGEGQGVDVLDDRCGGVSRAAAGHDEGQLEYLERADDAEYQHHGDDRPHAGQRHHADLLPESGAFDVRRLV